jgi:hypothetical protein
MFTQASEEANRLKTEMKNWSAAGHIFWADR